MLSLEREIAESGGSEQLLAIERREVFSIYPELRVMSWGGVMLIVAGVGVIVSENLDRIGPMTLAASLAIMSAACYAYAIWRRSSRADSLVDDFVLLLGALLLSADLGYIESQFHLLDADWYRHFLILAIVHAIGAYCFDSRTLLSLSITSLAAWLRIESRPLDVFDSSPDESLRMFLAAAIVVVWRFADRRSRRSRSFEPVFDHFAANLALYAALSLTFDSDTRSVGALLTVVLAAIVITYGVRTRSESFSLYAYVYGVIAIDIFVVDALSGDTERLLYLVVSTIIAIIGLFLLHAVFRRLRR